ncbi:MAG: hypothetical protein IJ315_05515 [Firmicutes bacterium]|nr:hypothetical protein [Bacillota bacterium]
MTELKYENRALRTHTGKLLFGPVGRRMWVDYLDRKPGFCGRIDFIHKTNLTQLFEVKCDREVDWELAQSVWYPDRLTMEYEDEDLAFCETKRILMQDLAFSVQEWTNKSEEPLRLEFCVQPKGAMIDGGYFETPVISYDYKVGGAAEWNLPGDSFVLDPGAKVRFMAACQLGNASVESREEIQAKLDDFWTWADQAEAKADQEWTDFMAGVPEFECSHPMLNKAWVYRWFINKHCTSYPEYGNFKQAVMFEGRSHRMNKTPYVSSGWEFTKLIPLSTSLHVTDYRWHHDHEIVHDFLRSFFDSADENGIPRCTLTNDHTSSYANYGLWAAYQLYLIDGDKAFLQESLPAMKAYVAGHKKVYGEDVDELQIEYTHSRTGKEYQPSYWYFHNYPINPKDKTTYTPLKRVDRSVYHYLNVKGLAAICRILGDADAAKYEAMAQTIAEDVNAKMWDEETQFFYDLHYQTDEKAMVKNIVGVYPYWAEITANEQLSGLEYLMNPDHFDTGNAFPSVSKENPVYSPDGGWQGNFIKGRNGCVWCGPSWPYTTAIALSALGQQSKLHEHQYDGDFWRFFRQYTNQHFRDGDINRPYLVEHYNPESGERLSDEVDYNHSYWIDLVVSFVAGVDVKEDCIVVDPLHLGLKWFKLKNLDIRGHYYTISWGKDGMKIYKDEEVVHESNTLQKVVLLG